MPGFRVKFYKQDRRYKSGERLEMTENYDCNEELFQKIEHILLGAYRPEDGWRLSIGPSSVIVHNLMSGAPVEIDADDRGGPTDPSMERYWTM